MTPPDESLTLRERLLFVPQQGRVTWIGLRPDRDVPMVTVEAATALEGRGLEGDRAARSTRRGGKRQVTLIQAEHLTAIASILGVDDVHPARVRRNVAVAGVNLIALKSLRFSIGEVVLEGTGPCEPCAKMDAALGVGGFAAMRGMGGITARVVRGGRIERGAAVIALGPAPPDDDTP